MADIAATAGARAVICMMPVPTLTVLVFASSHAAVVMASVPYTSAVQSEW